MGNGANAGTLPRLFLPHTKHPVASDKLLYIWAIGHAPAPSASHHSPVRRSNDSASLIQRSLKHYYQTMALSSFFRSQRAVFAASIILRAVFLLYGLWQDAYSPVKYTDIDYFVFTDAARFISRGQSPYARDTYRYTPLLAWLIYPTVWPGKFWFSLLETWLRDG
jgi:hypothetical protein